MTFAQKLACHVSPLFIRVVLALTLLWTGLGKLVPDDYAATPQNAQQLVRMGAIEQSRVQDLLPPGFSMDASTSENAAEPEPDDAQAEPPADDGTPDDTLPPAGDSGAENEGGGSVAVPTPAIVLVSQTTPEPDTNLQRLFGVSVLVADASRPRTDADGTVHGALLPAFMGKGQTPKYLGWAAAIAEVFAGGFLLIGFLTRISAIVAGGVLGMAIWLTQIGPAIMGHHPSLLGFLPAPSATQSVFDIDIYATLAWQSALLACAIALLLSGAGALSLDRLLFGGSDGDLEIDD